ncbi:zinc ribbon domain-containing protein [Thermus scotoductus]|uniref:zinc ribbon domain-containing protein n=1 Tax=Thermus scotoductus TaxID=37636 RepID=UPI003C6EAD0D
MGPKGAFGARIASATVRPLAFTDIPHAWAFSQLQRFLEYKALAKGIPVIYVDAHNTSRTCPRRGHCKEANRVSQALFRCLRCGFQHHADLVTSINQPRRLGE